MTYCSSYCMPDFGLVFYCDISSPPNKKPRRFTDLELGLRDIIWQLKEKRQGGHGRGPTRGRRQGALLRHGCVGVCALTRSAVQGATEKAHLGERKRKLRYKFPVGILVSTENLLYSHFTNFLKNIAKMLYMHKVLA